MTEYIIDPPGRITVPPIFYLHSSDGLHHRLYQPTPITATQDPSRNYKLERGKRNDPNTEIKCTRCKYSATRRGHTFRCSRTTCKIGGYCFAHLKTLFGLEVKQSTIPGAGLGLFATRHFAHGAIMPMTGTTLFVIKIKDFV